MRRLSHPHVVRGYEVMSEPRPLVVMETLTGGRRSPTSSRSRRGVCRQPRSLTSASTSARRSRYLHGQGWLHLDLKPSNVVAEAGRAKLIDLSVARAAGPRRRPASARGATWPPSRRAAGCSGRAADVWGSAPSSTRPRRARGLRPTWAGRRGGRGLLGGRAAGDRPYRQLTGRRAGAPTARGTPALAWRP